MRLSYTVCVCVNSTIILLYVCLSLKRLYVIRVSALLFVPVIHAMLSVHCMYVL